MKINNNIYRAGDIVRYPLGMHSLLVRKVYEDKTGVYVRELINTENEYKRYIYQNMQGYEWDTRLIKELGFGHASEKEKKYLVD